MGSCLYYQLCATEPGSGSDLSTKHLWQQKLSKGPKGPKASEVLVSPKCFQWFFSGLCWNLTLLESRALLESDTPQRWGCAPVGWTHRSDTYCRLADMDRREIVFQWGDKSGFALAFLAERAWVPEHLLLHSLQSHPERERKKLRSLVLSSETWLQLMPLPQTADAGFLSLPMALQFCP